MQATKNIPIEEAVVEMAAVIKKEVDRSKGVLRIETCDTDAYGWCLYTHNVMQEIQRRGIKGHSIKCKYKFQVWEWTVTKTTEGGPL